MEKKLTVTGMMCKHCEARVKKALETLEGVECAAPDHEKNEVILTMSEEIADEVLAQTIIAAGYKVTRIE